MKAQSKNQYDFTQASPSGLPGFEVFKSVDNPVWYFHGNNVSGEATLFSQGYRSVDSAERGLKSVLNELQKKRGKVIPEAGYWHISIRAGNNQEIARSSSFPTEQDATKCLRYFQNVALSANPIAVAEKPLPEGIATGAGVKLPADSPARHAFRLLFYSTGKEGAINGRIEKIGSSGSLSFKGIDGDSILAFLQRELNSKDRGANSDVTAPAAPAMLASSAAALTTGNRAAQTAVRILFPVSEIPFESHIEGCTTTLRHMETQETKVRHQVNANLSGDGQLTIELDIQNLAEGSYHLNTTAWLRPPLAPETDHALLRFRGTAWLQLI